jgi:Family of unknown function (DUF5908)
MPLEIRELQIKVTVDQPQGQNAPPQNTSPGSMDKNDKEAIINQCIDQVMEILTNKKER